MREIHNDIDSKRELFETLAKKLWEAPELSFEEKESSALQKQLCRDLGFKVNELDHIQPYAFIAEYGKGAPVIGFLGEYDALPGLSQKIAVERAPVHAGAPGHACGHNLLGTACLAAAQGLKSAIEAGAVRGTVRYFGCPAEEQLGKPILARAGVFDGLDAALCWHPSDLNTVAAYGTNASVQLEFSFGGKPAHAAQVPHMGRSALDAVTLMNIGMEFLREHMPQSARTHYIVTSGGERANIVPEYAAGIYQIRSPRMKEAISLVARVVDIAKGAALMTGTKMSYRLLHGCHDVVPNMVISDVLHENLKAAPFPVYDNRDKELAAGLCATITKENRRATLEMLGLDAATAEELSAAPLHEGIGYWGKGWTIPASTDVGDVSHIVPTAQINTATWPMGIGSHTWQATAASGSAFGMKSMIYAAQVMAGAAYDLMREPNLLEDAKKEFARSTRGEAYKAAADLIGELADSQNEA